MRKSLSHMQERLFLKHIVALPITNCMLCLPEIFVLKLISIDLIVSLIKTLVLVMEITYFVE